MISRCGNGNPTPDRLSSGFQTAVAQGQECVMAGVKTMGQQAKAALIQTDAVVRGRPYHAMGVMFGLGVLVGVLAGVLFARDQDSDQ